MDVRTDALDLLLYVVAIEARPQKAVGPNILACANFLLALFATF